MMLKSGDYCLIFENGGIRIEKNGTVLYFNLRPMYAFVKTTMAVTEFFDCPYSNVNLNEESKADAEAYTDANTNGEEKVNADGTLTTPNGSKLFFSESSAITNAALSL